MQALPETISKVVILQYASGQLLVTLSESSVKTDAKWTLPKTKVKSGQTSLQSLEATLRSTIGLRDDDVSYREQLYTFESASDTDSEVCIAYIYLSRGTKWHKGSDQIGLFPVTKLPKLTNGDGIIIKYALERLHAKALYTSITGFVLPDQFNLLELQQAFETMTGQATDRRNFRKKMLALDMLSTIKSGKQSSTSQPQLYSFSAPDSLQLYANPFLPK